MRALCLMILTGCLKAGTYPLHPAAGGVDAPGLLDVTAQASVDYAPSEGFDLTADITITWSGQASPRLDFARALVRVNGSTWEPCRHAEDADPAELISIIDPGDRVERRLVCRDIPRPDGTLELRFYASGTGERGVVDVTFDGIRQ